MPTAIWPPWVRGSSRSNAAISRWPIRRRSMNGLSSGRSITIVRRNSGPEISPVDPPLRGLAFATWLRAGSPRASSPVVIDAVRRSGAFLLFPEILYRIPRRYLLTSLLFCFILHLSIGYLIRRICERNGIVRNYTAIIEKGSDTGLFVGYIPGLRGAHS